jgi:hypothetical protein
VLVNFRFKPETLALLRREARRLSRMSGRRVTMTDVVVLALARVQLVDKELWVK